MTLLDAIKSSENIKKKILARKLFHGKVLEVQEVVDSVKYLGITITSDLRWNQHISNTATKGNETLGFLRRNLRIISANLKSIAYKA